MATLDPSMHARSPAGASARDRAMMAHDVRGALQGIVGGVAMLDRAGLAPAQQEQLDRIEAASRSLSRLLGGLVEPEGPAPVPGMAAPCMTARGPGVDLRLFLRDLGRRWIGEARERGAELAVTAAADAPALLHADFVALERAVGNLICNALGHAVDHGGGTVRVDLRGEAGGAVLTVRDAGPGLAAEPRGRGAWPGRDRGQGQAQGLGLHIVGQLCAEMGAAFAMTEQSGGGVEARIAFPAFLCAAAEEAPAAAPPPAPAEVEDLRGLRVLLAEDNPTNQMVAIQMLRALGAEVVLGVDGVDALSKFEAAPFDLVVADIEMPRMSGLDVIRAIRARGDARAQVPIVALTAYAMREHRDRIAAAGANGLISKPITGVAALGRALRAHMGPAAAPPEPAASPEPVADMQVFEALCAAIGMGMMAELLDKVVADLAQARADLEGALAPLDRKAIRSASHILISVAGAVGATRLQSCARRLNVAAHSGDEAALPSGVRQCVAEIDAAVEFARSRRPAG